jgi:hypothetical protein
LSQQEYAAIYEHQKKCERQKKEDSLKLFQAGVRARVSRHENAAKIQLQQQTLRGVQREASAVPTISPLGNHSPHAQQTLVSAVNPAADGLHERINNIRAEGRRAREALSSRRRQEDEPDHVETAPMLKNTHAPLARVAASDALAAGCCARILNPKSGPMILIHCSHMQAYCRASRSSTAAGMNGINAVGVF